jgi:hypothetical protein
MSTSDVAHRAQRIVESLQENEALTANLDDDAAAVLLEWGSAAGQHIAGRTAGLADTEATVQMEPQVQALRRLLRLVNNYFEPTKQAELAANPQQAAEANRQLVEQISAQVATMEGLPANPLTAEQLDALVQSLTTTLPPPAFIAQLRAAVEPSSAQPALGNAPPSIPAPPREPAPMPATVAPPVGEEGQTTTPGTTPNLEPAAPAPSPPPTSADNAPRSPATPAVPPPWATRLVRQLQALWRRPSNSS